MYFHRMAKVPMDLGGDFIFPKVNGQCSTDQGCWVGKCVPNRRDLGIAQHLAEDRQALLILPTSPDLL